MNNDGDGSQWNERTKKRDQYFCLFFDCKPHFPLFFSLSFFSSLSLSLSSPHFPLFFILFSLTSSPLSPLFSSCPSLPLSFPSLPLTSPFPLFPSFPLTLFSHILQLVSREIRETSTLIRGALTPFFRSRLSLLQKFAIQESKLPLPLGTEKRIESSCFPLLVFLLIFIYIVVGFFHL